MTYTRNALKVSLRDLPPELAGFSEFNPAIVAFRFIRRRRSEVPIERWVEAAKWAANKPSSEAGSDTPRDASQVPTMTAVLDRLGLTKRRLYENS